MILYCNKKCTNLFGALLTLTSRVWTWRTTLDEGNLVNYYLDDNRMPFIYVIKGNIEVNGEKLESNDQARISEETQLYIKAINNAELLLIDVSV